MLLCSRLTNKHEVDIDLKFSAGLKTHIHEKQSILNNVYICGFRLIFNSKLVIYVSGCKPDVLASLALDRRSTVDTLK